MLKVHLSDILAESRRVYGRTEARERVSAMLLEAERRGVVFKLEGAPVSWSALTSPESEDYWRAEKVTLHGLELHQDLLGEASLEYFEGGKVAFFHLQTDSPGMVVNRGERAF